HNWYPFQVICEHCGKIATTVVTDYQDEKVFYTCEENSTDWVKGCGHSGWISPFNGNGKLPWKVEWVAKWEVLGVTIEMAGKDHSQKGGSRDVANAIYRKVLNKKAPFHSPYEFILVGGTKMSSSKGVGSSAKDMAALLPPELLRFLMLRTMPKSVINFEPNYETTTRLFRDYDTLIQKYANLENKADLSQDLLPLFYAQLDEEIKTYQPFELSTIISLLQVPHLDINQEITKRSETPLNDFDLQVINKRIEVGKKWLEDYADEEEKLILYLDKIPEQVKGLTQEQISYLRKLAEDLATVENWSGEELQTALFTTTKSLSIAPTVAFPAVYFAFLGKEKGPKAGHLLSYLDKSFVLKRLEEVSK
ncbi:MAG TPA: lysine--tRNA ligase, partial [Allocoleopsis sp.]